MSLAPHSCTKIPKMRSTGHFIRNEYRIAVPEEEKNKKEGRGKKEGREELPGLWVGGTAVVGPEPGLGETTITRGGTDTGVEAADGTGADAGCGADEGWGEDAVGCGAGAARGTNGGGAGAGGVWK